MAMRTLPRNLKKSTHAHTNKETHKQKHPFQKLLPPVAASSCGALANQGPQEPIEAKEHNRKTNNAKEEKKRKKQQMHSEQHVPRPHLVGPCHILLRHLEVLSGNKQAEKTKKSYSSN